LKSPEDSPPRSRLQSVDMLRGIVMILMALDHTRAFFGTSGWDPDFATAETATSLTRWVTHFCAPVFVFVAGVAASLALGRGRSKSALARFLVTRGVWIALLDVTVISFAWFFRVGEPFVSDVMWVIGWSMIVLAALVWLPVRLTAIVGVTLIAGHNALDGIHAGSFGSAGWIWTLLHEQGMIRSPFGDWFVGYPFLPWVGVMALGYSLGFILANEPQRRRYLALLGGSMVIGFLVLRGLNIYGDPKPWVRNGSMAMSVLSFVNCQKYPPSLLYLLMTLGPALLVLALLDPVRVSPTNPLLIFGRVPLFFYVVHLYLIHLASGLIFLPRFGAAAFHVDPDAPPAGFGVTLGVIYLLWIGIVLAIYPLCRWFAGVKQRHRNIWLSYL
jgi:uncharacterized membrane protein